MKKIVIFVLLFVTFFANQAAAQSFLNRARAAAKNISRLKSVKTTNFERAARTAPVRPQRFEQVTPPPLQNSRLSNWLTTHQRLAINLQRIVGVSKIKAIRNVRDWGAQRLGTNPRPALLANQAFQTDKLTPFIVPADQINVLPPHPFQNQRLLIYRGLALDTDGQAIRNILENGLRLQDVGPHSNTLIYSLAGPHSRSSAVRAPINNLTDNADDAANWAKKRQSPSQLCVVTVVQAADKGAIITYSNDIPAESVYAVTALLMVDGIPTWCKVEREGENFLVTPYPPVQK